MAKRPRSPEELAAVARALEAGAKIKAVARRGRHDHMRVVHEQLRKAKQELLAGNVPGYEYHRLRAKDLTHLINFEMLLHGTHGLAQPVPGRISKAWAWIPRDVRKRITEWRVIDEWENATVAEHNRVARIADVLDVSQRHVRRILTENGIRPPKEERRSKKRT